MHQLRRICAFVTFASLGLAASGTAAAQDFPEGTFTLKAPDGATWAVKADGKDKFVVTRDGKEAVEGTYKVTKGEIEFTDEKGPFADKAAGPGTYEWKLDGNKLIFTKVKDKSEGRSKALTAGPWQKKEDKSPNQARSEPSATADRGRT